ncbi:MAG: patatin-like phospholipase family protein [Cyclobacteriaceae bacterium]
MMQEDKINLGLVMAGAVSAGAYTAGVVDFLTEALDVWEANKKINNAPPHQVVLKVISGASAGGMTAGILAKMLYQNFEHYHHSSNVTPKNDLYQAWVEEVSFSELLSTDDIKAEGVKSVLNGNMVKRIARKLIVEDTHFYEKKQKIREYVDPELEVYYTLANLKGVPYDVTFQGNANQLHRLFIYSDFIKFRINQYGNLEYNNADSTNNVGIINLYALSAVATGAFPVGLPAVTLNRKAGDYKERVYQIPNQKGCLEPATITPDWNDQDLKDYEFVSVDGGTFNNEPFNLALQELQKEMGEQQAIIMVDPFPNDTEFDVKQQLGTDLLSVTGNLIKALLGQARFRIEDLYKAFNEKNNDRFLVAPKRSEIYTMFPIACGYLDGFSGFLHKDFRKHDYQLGKRNCQRFLTKYFRLPADNPLFRNWTPIMKEEYMIEGKYLPIIPVLNLLKEVIPQPCYPKYDESKVEQFKSLIDRRVKAIFNEYVNKIDNWFIKLLLKSIFLFMKKKVTRGLIDSMKKNMKGGKFAEMQQGLIRPDDNVDC